MSKVRLQAWSCGGGTQSAAIAALIVQGKLPKPDLAVIVDTEREKTSTWEYAESVLIPNLREVGVTLHRVPKSEYTAVDLVSRKGVLLLPVFTDQPAKPRPRAPKPAPSAIPLPLWDDDEEPDYGTPLPVIASSSPDGKVGKFTNWCSGEWKRDVILRWLRSQGVKQCDTWVGISVNEMSRMRVSRVQWARNRYPLIEPEFGLCYRRSDCVEEVRRLGWPDPPRSACWMCPNMSDAEWLEMKLYYPADFARAAEFEHWMRETDPHFWLHESCIPIDRVDFSAGRHSIFEDRGCASGYCFV